MHFGGHCRVFNFERIASFIFAAAGLCVNLKSKEGFLLRIFSASRGLAAYYILMYPMPMCVCGCRGTNPDQENANAMLPLLYAVPRYANVIKSR